MRVVFWSRGKDLNARGRGEDRWNVNLAYFLQSEGVDVLKGLPNLRYKGSVFLDAPDDCRYLLGKKHVHFKFSYSMPELRELPCYREGELLLANPYRNSFEAGKKFWAGDRKVKFLFLPIPYPDRLLPGGLEAGFRRKTITWASKDVFDPRFEKDPGSQYVGNNGEYALRAVEKLSRRTEISFICIMYQMLGTRGEGLVAQLPQVKKYQELPWSELVGLMSQSKLNLCPAGSAGSVLESIFTKGLPVQNEGTFFSPRRKFGLLPPAQQATQQDWDEALEAFWLDEQAYQQAWEYYQDVFQDHRTDGARRAWQEALRTIGV